MLTKNLHFDMSLLDRFVKNWKDKKFLDIRPVLLAVSGGIDSMAMANLCLQAKIPIAVGHCNFKLRGEEADKDEQLVKEWCAANSIQFHHTAFDTQAVADDWKKGIQETARILRYNWLGKIKEEYNYSYVATAHHADDNAETLLMNLFKGTGMSGLHGIQHMNGHVIRPLLFAKKDELIEYVASEEVAYRDDASNATDKYTRNNIRLNILPLIKESFPNIVDNLNNSIERFTEAEELYNKAIDEERKKLLEKRGKDYYISIKKLLLRTPLKTICYELLKPFGFSSAQIPEVIKLLHSESGQYIRSDDYRIINNRGFLIITSVKESDTDIIHINDVPAKVNLEGRILEFRYVDSIEKIPSDNSIACINSNKLEFPLVLRKWRIGDYFYPFGMGMKKKKLSRFFIDQKIPIHEKENIWILESNKRIIWIVGYRLDERFKISNKQERVLTIG